MREKSPAAKPSIFQYDDYRSLLKDLFAWRKKTSPGFSFEYCGKKMGTSKTYLKQVFDRRAHVDINRCSSLARLFKLDPAERQFFVVLLIENQLTDAELKSVFAGVRRRLCLNEEIEGLKAYRQRARESVAEPVDWLSQVLGAMTAFPDFDPDPKWLVARLSDSVPPAAVVKSMKALLESKKIIREGSGYRETNTHHSPDPFEIDSHKRYLAGALKAVEVLSGDLSSHRPALFFNGALALGQQDQRAVADAYYRFVQDLVTISEKSKHPDRVLFVSNNLFHVTRET